jgi:hypothetical protein
MTEEKILIPAYKRRGNCARCGADIYAPDLKVGGGWPLMSACACAQGPQVAAVKGRAEDSGQSGEAKPEEKARAA